MVGAILHAHWSQHEGLSSNTPEAPPVRRCATESINANAFRSFLNAKIPDARRGRW